MFLCALPRRMGRCVYFSPLAPVWTGPMCVGARISDVPQDGKRSIEVRGIPTLLDWGYANFLERRTSEVRRITLPRTSVNGWSLTHRLMKWSSPGVARRFRPRPLAPRKHLPEYRLLPLAKYFRRSLHRAVAWALPCSSHPDSGPCIPCSRIRFLSLALSTNLQNGSLLPLVMPPLFVEVRGRSVRHPHVPKPPG
jgi:hypothetical protein